MIQILWSGSSASTIICFQKMSLGGWRIRCISNLAQCPGLASQLRTRMTIWLFWSYQIFLAVAPFRVLEIISEMDRSQAKREHGGIRSPPVSTAQQWTWRLKPTVANVPSGGTPHVRLWTPYRRRFFDTVRWFKTSQYTVAMSQNTSEPVGIPLLAADQHITYVRRFAFNHFSKFGSWRLWIDFLLPTKAPSGSNHNLCQIPCAFFVDSYEGRTVVLLRWQDARYCCGQQNGKKLNTGIVVWSKCTNSFEKTSQDCHLSTFFACHNPSAGETKWHTINSWIDEANPQWSNVVFDVLFAGQSTFGHLRKLWKRAWNGQGPNWTTTYRNKRANSIIY